MVDVTVLGAGAFGLSVAWACAKRGAKVRVTDPQGKHEGEALLPGVSWQADQICRTGCEKTGLTSWSGNAIRPRS